MPGCNAKDAAPVVLYYKRGSNIIVVLQHKVGSTSPAAVAAIEWEVAWEVTLTVTAGKR